MELFLEGKRLKCLCSRSELALCPLPVVVVTP